MMACPRCQTANPPTARFCRSCGEPCAPAAPSAPPVEQPGVGVSVADAAPTVDTPTLADATLAFATVSGKISLADTFKAKPAHPLELPPAVPEIAPPPPLVEPVANEETPPLSMSFNFPHVLIAGHSTTFQLLLENTGAEPLEYVQVRLESRGLKETITKSVRRLGPRQTSQPMTLEIDPARPGRSLLRCTVRLHAHNQGRSYVGERDIAINDLPENPQSLSINIHDIMSNGGGGANANLGAEYGDVNINNLLGNNVLRSLNDLINLELPARFQPLTLALDYEISERAPAPQPSSGSDGLSADAGDRRSTHRLTIPAAFLGFAQAGGLLRLTPTQATTPAAIPVQLVARGEFRLGRSRPEVDFVTWFLPRTPDNDTKTKCLSRVHLLLTLQGDRLLASAPRGSGGKLPRATIDGQEINADQPLALDGRAALGLGAEYFLDMMPFGASEPAGPPIANLAHWPGPAAGRRPGRGGCVRLLPLAGAESLWQSIWMFSEAAFGSNRCNPIILAGAGIEEIQGRFFHHRQGFWLEKSVAGGQVEINGTALRAGEIVPLVTGQAVRLGEIEYRTEVET